MPEPIIVTTAVKFKRWQVPNYVAQDMPPRPKQEGMTELPKLHVREVPYQVLNAMVEAWLQDLYANAEQANPYAARASQPSDIKGK